MLERAILAAQRGVKVRLIVDDLILQGHDQLIANMHAQANIEFRLFNPWEDRSGLAGRAGEMLGLAKRGEGVEPGGVQHEEANVLL